MQFKFVTEKLLTETLNKDICFNNLQMQAKVYGKSRSFLEKAKVLWLCFEKHTKSLSTFKMLAFLKTF